MTFAETNRLNLSAMTASSQHPLPPEVQLALAHTGAPYRVPLSIFFELDLRLGRILARTNEPMLGQMRLAWWRETIEKPVAQRPSGDPVLDAISEHWIDRDKSLISLIDGWEKLLAEPPLGRDHIMAFAQGRIEAVRAAFGAHSTQFDQSGAAVQICHWAIADLAAGVTLPEERKLLVEFGLENISSLKALGKPFKGIALLGALALRSLDKGGRPLMEGRGAAITAIRAAIIGR